MSTLRLPKDWLGDDFELEVVGRRAMTLGNDEVVRPDDRGDLKVSCLIHNAADLILTAGAVAVLTKLIAEILAEAAQRAHQQDRREITETDLTSSSR